MHERFNNRRRCVVRVLVETIAPDKGSVYDPCCGSAGRFVQGETFFEEHGGRITPSWDQGSLKPAPVYK